MHFYLTLPYIKVKGLIAYNNLPVFVEAPAILGNLKVI